ncbi:HAD-IIIC family phosphatase [Virgibacillus pantothenticus]|uniref:HAD-IIIC family phosphatase n=1 Tax=Virgibacillus pantothenticus TaxID=1473 RepID=UPI001C22D5FF|nr:HAD-IIIC family phosphatase [Virgibacillus pantothenticus]MBU8567947.1 HAD-IIIC family phosphatase [Virgibacillus pantothenticus]MBU8601796.1 HAD-IIIC family phosphatase [Virgibacillus pantothenticus]MBU8635950.1 HAD-IIIC family phosphatase [Virgibacillus pantothenticus]MBU8643634.1 HAD-IIIC family phosphatase [Virgibacillus pantothenticus]MBU8647774.1 HAD-IIIC family phosphatase [Virgibacillus pantothenticus]
MDKDIKCVIWDLDDTLWTGTLLEPNEVKLKPGIIEILKELDKRGILNSIASKNNYTDAMEKLEEFNIAEYFLYPEINWNAKSLSIQKICKNINIGLDSILFIDDQEYERDEVKYRNSSVSILDASEYQNILNMPRFNPRFITIDSMNRRKMYLEDQIRKEEEEKYNGPQEKFLASLNMKLIISDAMEEDLMRAEELTIRTNQLNATGKTYSYEELDYFRQSDRHKLLIAELKDKYGSQGKIGLALIEEKENGWHLHLLLMSCRVMSRGVGTVFLLHIINLAKEANVELFAYFKKTDRNKMMYLTYTFANFIEYKNDSLGNIIFKNDLSKVQDIPYYINVEEI